MSRPHLARLAMSSASVPSSSLTELLDASADAGLGGVGLWRDVYAGQDLASVRAAVVGRGLAVTSVCRAGMFPVRTAREREERRADNRAAVVETAQVGGDCLVLVCGAAVGGDLVGARRQIADGIRDLLPLAGEHQVRLAVEPMHPMMIADRSAVTSLGEAVDLLESLDHELVGLALDAYHVWWDVRWPEQLRRASERLFAVQVSDWVTPITHQLRSRGMPGEGVIDLDHFLDVVHQVGYRGLVEVEVLSDAWAARPARDAYAAVAAWSAGA